MANVRKAGMIPIGAGINFDQFSLPVFLDVKGTRLGVLAFNDTGTNYLGQDNPGAMPALDSWVEQSIKEARDSVDILIVQIHWGYEDKELPSERQIELGHNMVKWGADIVVGHHPHQWQPIEFYQNSVIAYSIGNFTFDQNDVENNLSGVLVFKYNGKIRQDIYVLPVELISLDGFPAPATGELLTKFEDYIRMVNANFNSRIYTDSMGFHFEENTEDTIQR